ncbi:MAG: PmoA family protein [Dysgonamonadaceae bacterium]|jgi:hypothetical protein|nr:PmoA family protein [Dysgonamonadaceae bacterium]
MRTLIISLICFLAINAGAAGKIKITVQAGVYDRENCVVSTDVSALNLSTSSAVGLFETSGKQKKPVPSQLVTEAGKVPRLYWILDGKTPAGIARTFVAEKVKRKQDGELMHVEDNQKALILKKGDKNILQYNYAHVESPAGIDKSYGRSGFIHPAYSPGGNILTTIQPKDHYHHYGIWNPWTRVLYDGKMYDLWNLADKQGTVRAKDIEATYCGNVFSGYVANLDHYIFMPEEEKVIMNECWKVSAWNVPEGFLWDFESHLYPSTPLPVLLKEYRYAGFGYRATEKWTKENCEMLTSEGKTRQHIDGSTARWIFITGATETGRSGLLFMGHPGNYNFPEPLRIWDENANGGRGDAFINFAPTKNKDWELKPGERYLLRYRILSYEGEMTKEKADRLWNDFAHPVNVVIDN